MQSFNNGKFFDLNFSPPPRTVPKLAVKDCRTQLKASLKLNWTNCVYRFFKNHDYRV